MKKCSTRFCRKPAARRPNGRSYGSKCHACRCAAWRANQPFRDAYVRLKSHAVQRGLDFAISFEYFHTFAVQTKLLTQRGIHGEALTVDRIDNLRGYVPGNIQPLTRSANSVKRAKQDQMRMTRGYAWQR